MFVNTVFGVIKLSILLGVAESAGGTVAGYDAASLSTYTWVSQGMIAVVMIFGWTELADRVRTGDIAVDLARPVDLQLAWLAADLGRAAWGLVSRARRADRRSARLLRLRAARRPAGCWRCCRCR